MAVDNRLEGEDRKYESIRTCTSLLATIQGFPNSMKGTHNPNPALAAAMRHEECYLNDLSIPNLHTKSHSGTGRRNRRWSGILSFWEMTKQPFSWMPTLTPTPQCWTWASLEIRSPRYIHLINGSVSGPRLCGFSQGYLCNDGRTCYPHRYWSCC